MPRGPTIRANPATAICRVLPPRRRPGRVRSLQCIPAPDDPAGRRRGALLPLHSGVTVGCLNMITQRLPHESD
eukprot:110983-Hanusia_phi.AAC.1